MAVQPERLEDLGRIREKLEFLLNDFEELGATRMHEIEFIKRYKNDDSLDTLRRSLKYLHEEIQECVWIAKGDSYE